MGWDEQDDIGRDGWDGMGWMGWDGMVQDRMGWDRKRQNQSQVTRLGTGL